MAYGVLPKRSAEKELDRLPTKIHDRIAECLASLRENTRPHGAKKLHGREAYRVRVGDYRILYVVDDTEKRIDVFSIAHRREVYH